MSTEYEKIKELYLYYQTRYEKAQKLKIDKNSKYYNLFQEIEKRYLVLGICLEFAEKFPKNKTKENLRKCLDTIGELLFPLEKTIVNGREVSKEQKVIIKQTDKESSIMYLKAKRVLNCLYIKIQNNFANNVDDILEDFFIVVQLYLRARELEFPIKKQIKIKNNKYNENSDYQMILKIKRKIDSGNIYISLFNGNIFLTDTMTKEAICIGNVNSLKEMERERIRKENFKYYFSDEYVDDDTIE